MVVGCALKGSSDLPISGAVIATIVFQTPSINKSKQKSQNAFLS